MKQQVFYIHGGSAFSTNEAWLQYLSTVEIKNPTSAISKPQRWSDRLREDLGGEYEVFAPAMPSKYNSKYEEWKIWFERHFEWLRDDITLLGWSQGGMFLVKYLTENDLPVRVKRLVLVAAPFQAALHPDVDYHGEDGGDFIFDTEKVQDVAAKVGDIHIFHSTDDFVVPYVHAEQFAAAWPSATLHTHTAYNHYLVPDCPEIVACITDQR